MKDRLIVLGLLFSLIILGWLYSVFGFTVQLILPITSAVFLIPIFLTDLHKQVIPDIVSIPGILIILGVQIWLGTNWNNLLFGALVGGGFFWLQFILSRGRWIGSGDIGLGILMGVVLGFPNIIMALVIAYSVGAVVAISLIIVCEKQLDSSVPFGPFLTVATLFTLVYQAQIMLTITHWLEF